MVWLLFLLFSSRMVSVFPCVLFGVISSGVLCNSVIVEGVLDRQCLIPTVLP